MLLTKRLRAQDSPAVLDPEVDSGILLAKPAGRGSSSLASSACEDAGAADGLWRGAELSLTSAAGEGSG